jgi:predicted O-methyltransferase YrrM
MGVLNDPKLEARLAALHERSDRQIAGIEAHFAALPPRGSRPAAQEAAQAKVYLADKLVALDRDKAEFCYQLIRAAGARRVVECGTSYGVSTVYLAAAVRDNIAACAGAGLVVGTEYEPEKAAAARALFAETGVAGLIDLREGDLTETLKTLDGPIDFVLMDIWIAVVGAALERLAPHLETGAIIVADNTQERREDYAGLFAFLAANGFRTLTLPFTGGLELAVKG